MNNQKIISISGFAGSGKDTVANYICSKYNYKKLSFGNKLKNVVSDVFGYDRELLEGDTEESRIFREKTDEYWSNKLGENITPRYLLKVVGTDVLRNKFYENIWCDAIEKEILDNPNQNFVISDTRFKNEKLMAKNNNAILIRIKRGEDPVWYNDAIKYNNELSNNFLKYTNDENIHISEYDWINNDFDYNINNIENDLNNLYKQTDIILKIDK